MERLSKTISETVNNCQSVDEVMEKSENIAEDFCNWLEFSKKFWIEGVNNRCYRIITDCDFYLDIKEVREDIYTYLSDKNDFESFKEIILKSFQKYSLNLWFETH